jgi:hypothetical protein
LDICQGSFHHDQESPDIATSTQFPLETLAAGTNASGEVGRCLALDHHAFGNPGEGNVTSLQRAMLDAPSLWEVCDPRVRIRFSGVEKESHEGGVVETVLEFFIK